MYEHEQNKYKLELDNVLNVKCVQLLIIIITSKASNHYIVLKSHTNLVICTFLV